MAALRVTKQDFAGGGITEHRIIFIGGTCLLMHHEYLEAFAVGVEVTQVEGVAMACSCAPRGFAVIVESCCSKYDFVTSVGINVTDGERVGSFAIKAFSTGLRFVEPFFGELRAVKIHSPYIGGGIIAATEYRTRVFAHTVEIGHAGKITL